MEGHPIESMMKTAMESIKEMVDVNTVVGDPVETPDGTVIIPVSRVTAGFVAGGGEYEGSGSDNGMGAKGQQPMSYPFGGGSGAGVSVQPVAFLVSSGTEVKLLPINDNIIFDHMIDMAPKLLNQIKELFKDGNQNIEVQC
ncbi:MAG: sporulation protein YtfJ [Clostridia bacterium]|nr:sporulation protein YtfJ [Clostridia bacterium]